MNRLVKMVAAGTIATGTISAVVGFGASPLAAAPIEHVRDSGVFTEVVEDFCGDLDVRITDEFSEHVLIMSRNGVPYFQNNVRSVTTFTNLANNKTFTIESRFLDKDNDIVDNGDGTFTITIRVSGQTKVYGPDGEHLFLDAGMTLFQILVDNNGTPADPTDDEFITDLGVLRQAGRGDTAERDFCEDINLFIG